MRSNWQGHCTHLLQAHKLFCKTSRFLCGGSYSALQASKQQEPTTYNGLCVCSNNPRPTVYNSKHSAQSTT